MSSKSKNNTGLRIVCWRCGRGGQKGDAPLRKISKTDYVCLNDLQWGAPSRGFPVEEKERTAHDKLT